MVDNGNSHILSEQQLPLHGAGRSSAAAECPGRHSQRLLRLSGLLVLVLGLSSCTLHSGKDYNLTTECCFRDNFVLSRGLTRAIADVEHSVGKDKAAIIVAYNIRANSAGDHYVCPASAVCETTSEYTRSHPSDLESASIDSQTSPVDCIAITVLPSYNWTHKSAGCIRN